VSLLAGLLPVLLLLLALLLFDSFRLVRAGALLTSLGYGLLAALVCLVTERALVEFGSFDAAVVRRYAAPLLEETGKALYVVVLLRAGRTGFLVDSGLHGLAVGAGFALAETGAGTGVPRGAGVLTWLACGLGAAAMHGGATALFAILGKGICGRMRSTALHLFLPGLAGAMLLHSLLDHFASWPLLEAAIAVAGLPLVVAAALASGQRAISGRLGRGLDRDLELLEEILGGGTAPPSRVGGFLRSLETHLPGALVDDALRYVRLRVELSLREEGVRLAEGAGLERPDDPETPADLDELESLRRSIGRTGLLAIRPLFLPGHRTLRRLRAAPRLSAVDRLL
jgi:protease PrsW